MSRFITFEGTEGVGKTTQLQLLKSFLGSRGVPVILTREPGGTHLGERMREILLDNSIDNLNDTSELLMMFAARAQHLEEVIYPNLQRGSWVLCDRFTDATYAYQGGGRGIDFSEINELEKVVQKGFQPDLTLLLICDIKEGLQRVSSRGEKDRFETEKIEFYEDVQQAYLDIARDNEHRFKIIDAEQDQQTVAENIKTAVKEKFPELAQ